MIRPSWVSFSIELGRETAGIDGNTYHQTGQLG